MRFVTAPADNEAAGDCVMEIVIGAGLMVTIVLALLVGSAFDVAVTVTFPPVGTVAGAVYRFPTNLPHEPELPQVGVSVVPLG
jgi:hypothetical protein